LEWALVASNTYCHFTADDKKLADASSWEQCAYLAEADADCGNYIEYGSESHMCVCVLSGEQCRSSWMPYGGWSVYAKVTTTTTTTTQALCTNSNGGETDPYGDGCDAYLSSWCGGYDDTDFSSNAMCCICGGGNWLYSTTQAR
jgi:hypothetical protein